MRKVAYLLICAFIGVLTFSFSVSAQPFVNPPEDYTNYIDWETQFPYQRNIYWDFSVDPTIMPTSYNDPNADVHYEGYDDEELWSSDYVQLEGVSYFETDPTGTGRTGLIGIDNRDGEEKLYGKAIFRIDNHQREWPLKHLWKEIVFYDNHLVEELPMSFVTETMELDEGYEVTGAQEVVVEPAGDLFERHNIWYRIEPNPYVEYIILNFEVEGGAYAFVDSLHIATECIPEPATMMLLGSLATGLFGFAGLRRRIYK